jgi:RimJ/RimL family protein N-acetyltransferase
MDVWRAPTLRTERLLVRPFTATDFAAFRAYAADRSVDEYGSWLGGAGPDDAARYLVDTIARYGRPPRCDLGVSFEGQLVGGVAFRQVWISPLTMEIGWVLHPAVGGQGLASEAVGALLDWLFANFAELRRAEARVRESDERGVRLLEKLGFVREGVIRSEPGRAGNALLYGRLRGESTP